MSKSNTQRFDDAVKYLKSVDAGLGQEVENILNAKKAAVGQEISLEGLGYWKSGSDQQHNAVRAYLLCLIAYFRTPYSKFDFANTAALDTAKRELHGKSVTQVNDAIKLFLPKPGASYADIMSAALRVKDLSGVVFPMTRTRQDTNVQANPVCYHGVTTWLYAAGFISRRWMAKEGATIDGNNSNLYLTDGSVVPQDRWGSIPGGWIWNIHKAGDKTTCHWGVSLGGGRAVACNNSDGGLLQYEPGGKSQYGVFKLTDLIDILRRDPKYLPTGGAYDPTVMNITVRQMDPMAMPLR